MIIDNKDSNASWMQTVCSQFIDLVVPLIIEPNYREDIRWTLTYLMKLGSLWSVAGIYDLMRNGMLLYRYRQVIFHRHLERIRNFDVSPSVNACLGRYDETLRVGSILYCRDESTFMCSDKISFNLVESTATLDGVFYELKVGQEKKKLYQTNYRKLANKTREIRN